MKTIARIVAPALFPALFLAVAAFIPPAVQAQEGGVPPAVMEQAAEAVESGQISASELKAATEAAESGRISPEAVRDFQERSEMGTLTREEIEAGRRMLEETDPAEETKPPGEETAEERESAESILRGRAAAAARPEMEIFGHKLFTGAPSTFAPIQTVPVSDDYAVGPGDEIRVMLWGRLEASYSLTVDNEGILNLPKIGPIPVSGLNFGELKEVITRKVEAITGVNAHVSMGKLRTIQVFVLGEVKSPGLYTVSSLASVSNALLSSGGPARLGSLRKVELKRSGKTVSTIDFYDFLLKGDTSSDAHLMPADVIFVPQTGPMVTVKGNVRRPAVYELAPGDPLMEAIRLAGGMSATGYDQRIQVRRSLDNRMQVVLDVSYDQIRKDGTHTIRDGDEIRVFSITPQAVNAVFLYGNVVRPGEYAFSPGMRVLEVLPDANALERNTYLDYALIKRYRYTDARWELFPFDLGKLLISGDRSQNLPLLPLDEVYVFPKSMFEDRFMATVEGEVRHPGRYQVDHMTVRDLVLRAGGLTTDAFMGRAQLIRRDQDQMHRTIYIDLGAAMARAPDHDIPVQNEDRLVIHSIWERQWREFVTIEGEVKNPGRYNLTKGMTVKDLIFKAGNFTRDAYMEVAHIYRTDWRTKEVTIHTFSVDRALTGDAAHDIALQDFDRVNIHSTWEFVEAHSVAIKGMVNNPGSYPYATNMSVKDLILVAGNVKEGAFLREAELVRYAIVDGRMMETMLLDFDVEKALGENPAHDMPLKPMDVVTIKEISDWKDDKKTVTVRGEVFFPGTYQIRSNERLSEVIRRAGGFTPDAYLRGATLTRESVKRIQRQRLDELARQIETDLAAFASQEAQSALSKEDLATQGHFIAAQRTLLARMKEADPSGRVVMQVLPLEVMESTGRDIVVDDGDTFSVPKNPNTVNVLGAVYNPGAQVFQPGKTALKHYLGRTGGPTDNAEDKRMFLVRADGTVVAKAAGSRFGIGWDDEKSRWSFGRNFEDMTLHPGDTILVPHKVVKPSYMKNLKDITQILYHIAVTAGITITQVF